VLSSLSSQNRDDEYFFSLFAGIIDLKEISSILSYLARREYIIKQGEEWMVTEKIREFGSKLHSNIPGYESIRVIDQRTEEPIGSIELPVDNIFVLAGQAWMVRERNSDSVLVTPVDSATEVPNFSSYDRFGAFFDLLPQEIRIRCRKDIKRSAFSESSTEEILAPA
jgi:Lhr-like helicase